MAAAVPVIKNFLGASSVIVAFVPFATADNDLEGYADKVQEGLSSLPLNIRVVTPESGKEVIETADVIMVGGGNTFKLLHDIYHYDLFSLIQHRVKSGTPYIGWSAGSNLAGRTICTTNDMPILQPQSFAAFGFFPFQLNPHYYNVSIEGFHGETRDQRLIEYLQVNPGVPVVGLPEGTALQRRGDKLHLVGERSAVLFQNSREDLSVAKIDVPPAADLSFLLQTA